MSEIKDVKWEGQYGPLEGGFDGKCFWDGGGMGITYAPVCPHCGEFAYEENECVFCHRKYKLDWSKQPPAEPEQEEEEEEKAILMSIQPQWVAKILNGEKTIEVRKRFPKDFQGWVYIYCTKGELIQRHWAKDDDRKIGKFITYGRKLRETDLASPHTLNGKIVAKFWCDKVEAYSQDDTIRTSTIEKTCLTCHELWGYAGGKEACFIHIDHLCVFDEPIKPKGKAPQSWRYLTSEEGKAW